MIKLLSLFSGIGAFEKALDNLNIPFELVNYCEIDKYASKSYSAIHGVSEDKNLGDITKIDCSKLPPIDLVTYGFPCQDISLAGKQKGLFDLDGSLTRSGLFFEALKVIEHGKPKVAIAENVKALTNKKFKEQFSIVLESLELAGYNNYWKVLNAKDYGIPQNRERVFIVSIRKDIDTGTFEFPEPFILEKRLKDLLETTVNEKYYLSKSMLNYVLDVGETQKGSAWDGRCDNGRINSDVALTLGCRSAGGCQRAGVSNFVIDGIDEEMSVKDIKKIISVGKINSSQDGLVVDPIGISPTHTAGHGNTPKILVHDNDFDTNDIIIGGMQQHQSIKTDGICTTLTSSMGCGGGYVPMITVKEATKQGYAEAHEGDSINLEQPNSKTRRGRVGHQVAQTLTTAPNQAVVEPLEKYYVSDKGVKYITSPKRGMATDINHDVCQPLTAVGNTNWTGSFISDDIDHLEKSSEICGTEPTKIVMKNGDVLVNDGEKIELKQAEPKILEDFYANRDARVYEEYSPALRSERNGLKVVEPQFFTKDKRVLETIGKANFSEDALYLDVFNRNIIKEQTQALSEGMAHQQRNIIYDTLRIRKLTPKECFRLMGFDDEDFAKAEKVNSNAQLYKQAGNSIVVNVLKYLFKNLLDTEVFNE